MEPEFELAEKVLAVESDKDAIRNLAFAVGLMNSVVGGILLQADSLDEDALLAAGMAQAMTKVVMDYIDR